MPDYSLLLVSGKNPFNVVRSKSEWPTNFISWVGHLDAMSPSNWSLARTGFLHLLQQDDISCHYFIIWWFHHKMSKNFEQSTVSLSLVPPDNSFLSPCDQKIWENFEKSTHRIPLSTDFEKSTGFLSPRLPHADPLTSGSLGTLHSRPSSQEIKKNCF